ncbi:hypothetical protein EJ03DRAFT_345806 [Teratosphaeria nubilosa]|uniref:Arrestin-like N-terminal domain-containing protein n=1 Tax=Teratosphaeria nubilosa TaxID=161662 RepID=A0A6G1KX76_9PEZI|nr:hypothetical protein EJ03DRAFT_345806 [Teratosphaeria nubilosa]
MSATLLLDQSGNISYTNLDEISGRVVVRCAKSVDIDSITVKLEGDSRTRLMSAGNAEQRPKPQLEVHKILYRVQTVFPPANVIYGRENGASGKAAYTLPPGQHEYPFRFKIPFNNSCAAERMQMPTVSLSSGLEFNKPAPQHVKKTLPPTLSGFPGEAEIRYFVKATVGRRSMFKENPRAYVPFNFLPIEPPRPPATGAEIYARQKHSFSQYPAEPTKGHKMKEIFGMGKGGADDKARSDAPYVSIDARLPEPAILTCTKEIPLRLVLKKLNQSSDTVYLNSLQILLIGNTLVRAHEVFRKESRSWIIVSKSNMSVPIGLPTDAVDSEAVIDDGLWRGQPLPNTVAPSFETCNLSRDYELDIRVGLSYSGSASSSSKAQNIVLPLRLQTLVYSGIAPPPELLQAMEEARTHPKPVAAKPTVNIPDPTSEKLRMETRQSGFGSQQVPPTPIESPVPGSSHPVPAMPPRPGGAVSGGDAGPPVYEDAPPSYEDVIAMSGDVRPMLQSERPQYEVPPAGEDEALRRDEKRGWV